MCSEVTNLEDSPVGGKPQRALWWRGWKWGRLECQDEVHSPSCSDATTDDSLLAAQISEKTDSH